MAFGKDYHLAPERSYVFWAEWPDVRPSKDVVVHALTRFPYAKSTEQAGVAVISKVEDTRVNGVFYPLQSMTVEQVLAELAAIGASTANVADWPDDYSGRLARAYWDRLIARGIETQKTMAEIEAVSNRTFVWIGLLAAIGIGVFLAVRR